MLNLPQQSLDLSRLERAVDCQRKKRCKNSCSINRRSIIPPLVLTLENRNRKRQVY